MHAVYSKSEINMHMVHAFLCFVVFGTVNTLRPTENGRRLADDTFKRISLNENVEISIKISLKFIPNSPIENIPALAYICDLCNLNLPISFRVTSLKLRQ